MMADGCRGPESSLRRGFHKKKRLHRFRGTQIPHLTLLVWPLWFYRTCSLSTRSHICSDLGRREGFGRRF